MDLGNKGRERMGGREGETLREWEEVRDSDKVCAREGREEYVGREWETERVICGKLYGSRRTWRTHGQMNKSHLRAFNSVHKGASFELFLQTEPTSISVTVLGHEVPFFPCCLGCACVC